MAISDIEGILVKFLPVITPPVFLMNENKFPNLVEVFADISKNPPNPCLNIARKYLYLCRITGIIWVVWAVNFSLFMALALTAIFAWGGIAKLSPESVKPILAAGLAVLFVSVFVTSALLTLSIQMRDACYRLCGDQPKPALQA